MSTDGAQRVVDLAAGRDISRPAISRHLRVLGEAGLVEATDAGRERHYALNPDPLSEVANLLGDLSPFAPAPPVTDSMLDALSLEVRRTGKQRRSHTTGTTGQSTAETTTEETA